eukprot:12851167-Ditylum_brightwellii.AAC.1
MSLFKDEDVKKASRASVSASSVKDTVNQALNAPYVAPKRQINMASALLHSLNMPNMESSGD